MFKKVLILDKKPSHGNWEIETEIGQNHQGTLVTIVDGVSKFTLIKKMDSKRAEAVNAANINSLKPYPDKTLTGLLQITAKS